MGHFVDSHMQWLVRQGTSTSHTSEDTLFLLRAHGVHVRVSGWRTLFEFASEFKTIFVRPETGNNHKVSIKRHLEVKRKFFSLSTPPTPSTHTKAKCENRRASIIRNGRHSSYVDDMKPEPEISEIYLGVGRMQFLGRFPPQIINLFALSPFKTYQESVIYAQVWKLWAALKCFPCDTKMHDNLWVCFFFFLTKSTLYKPFLLCHVVVSLRSCHPGRGMLG